MQIHALTFALLVLKGAFAMKFRNDYNVTVVVVVEDEITTTNFSSLSLAIIIGSIVASFVVILALQWIIKRYICNKKKNDNGENIDEIESDFQLTHIHHGSILVTIPQTTTRPPSYENIHQYKQLDYTTCTPIYYNIPGTKTFHGILPKHSTSEEGIKEDDHEQPPPPYVIAEMEEESDV